MSFIKYAVPALAFAEAALAQSSCSASATTTITALADATAIAACTTFSGSIALATSLAESGTVSFDGSLEEIDGDLTATNATGVQSISASGLKTITGGFMLNDMNSLTNVNFPQLTNIRGALVWKSIPNLNGFFFGSGVQRINSVLISDTQIQNLTNINLKSAQSVDINNNLRLNTLAWQLASVDGLLNLDSNGGSAGFSASFGNLAHAGRVQINGVNNLTMNALINVTSTLQIYNTGVDSLNFPNLTMVGDFNIFNNTNLNNISVPALQSINGGLLVQRNPDLTGDVTFPVLKTVTGALNCTGAFNEFLTPKLNTVKGAFTITSTGDLTQTCQQVATESHNSVFQPGAGMKPCTGGAQNSTSITGATGTGSGASTSSTAAAVASYTIPSAVTLGSLFAAMLGML